ncbi:MAG TPA: BlaI/MecI/CopY family transcriptional regulator [Fimbriimonas sp.]|nr:BlaI/MecI/CopY family transcriptional regulator [Fimbriimonas sp.]
MRTNGLSRREREILDILHRLGKASVQEVCEAMEEAPSYSSVRSLLGILVEKGIANHHEDGKRYLYSAAESSEKAAQSAIKRVVDTFFGGKIDGVVRTFLSDDEAKLSKEELDELSKLIEEARKRGTK